MCIWCVDGGIGSIKCCVEWILFKKYILSKWSSLSRTTTLGSVGVELATPFSSRSSSAGSSAFLRSSLSSHQSIDFTTSWSEGSLMFLRRVCCAVEENEAKEMEKKLVQETRKVDVADGWIRIELGRFFGFDSLRRWSGFDSATTSCDELFSFRSCCCSIITLRAAEA